MQSKVSVAGCIGWLIVLHSLKQDYQGVGLDDLVMALRLSA
jgi:hypothetical protein